MSDDEYTANDLRKWCIDLMVAALEPEDPPGVIDAITSAALIEAYISTGTARVYVLDGTETGFGVTAH